MNLSEFLKQHSACKAATEWVAGRPATREVWRTCPDPRWMVWIARRAGVDPRRIVLAAAAFGWSALRHVRAGEERPARAVDLARRYGLGEDIPAGELRGAAAAAYAAAADAAADASANAAYAAAAASAAAYAADAYAADAADAAAYAAAAARSEENRQLCRYARHCIGWQRLRAALIEQGVEVGP